MQVLFFLFKPLINYLFLLASHKIPTCIDNKSKWNFFNFKILPPRTLCDFNIMESSGQSCLHCLINTSHVQSTYLQPVCSTSDVYDIINKCPSHHPILSHPFWCTLLPIFLASRLPSSRETIKTKPPSAWLYRWFLKSLLRPSRTIGTWGQKCCTSGIHLAVIFLNDSKLPME